MVLQHTITSNKMRAKTLTIIFVLLSVYTQAQKKDKANDDKFGKRHFGVGFNYTQPAPGLSAKISILKNDQFQFSVSQKSYQWDFEGFVGWGYNWNFYSAEYQHRYEPVMWLEKIQVYPFIYAGGGIGQIRWNADYFWYFGDGWEKNQEWYGYNLGGGAELFPPFFKNNMGFTLKLGFGSYAKANSFGYSQNGGYLLFGGSVHYYIL